MPPKIFSNGETARGMMAAENDPSYLLVWTAGAARDGVLSTMRGLGLAPVRTANTAVQAFSDLAIVRPRLILVEANMKPTNGLVFLRELRATPIDNRDVPIILCAPRPNEQMENAARQAGADGAIFGPPTPAAITFWLTSTAPDARTLVADSRYHGPDRRLLVLTDLETEERRHAEPEALAAAMARVAIANADPIVQGLGRAMELVLEWNETGSEDCLVDSLEGLRRLADIAKGRSDAALHRGLDAARHRIEADMGSWDADHIGMHGSIMVLQDLAARRAVQAHAKAI
jgi:CheY-like chemotaxis protein